MDRNKVLELAREIGAGEPESLYGRTDYVVMTRGDLERFAALIEREVRGDAASGDIHSCSYYCTRPECIKAQRDELRDRMESATVERFAALIEREVRGGAEPVAWIPLDEARFALWEAINKRKFGNPTDDKLILEYLKQNGLWIGKNAHPAPAVDAEKDAIRYRWLKENSARISWNPSRYNERIVDGFAAFGTGYLGYNFEQAVDLAMEAALAAAKEAGL